MSNHKTWRPAAILTVAATALALVGCAADQSAPGGDADGTAPFEVLALAPLSGALSGFGSAVQSGYSAAVDVVNNDGGIDGRQVVVEWVDTTSSPSEAVARLQSELSSGDKPDLVLPSVVSSETVALLPVLTQNEVLSVGTVAASSTTDPANWPYHFNTAVWAWDAIGALVTHLVDEGYEKVAVALPDSELGHDKWEAFEAYADEAGLETVHEFVDPASVDPTAELTRLQSESGVEALVLAAALGPVGGALLSAHEKLNWDVPVVMDDATSTNDYSSFGADALAGVTFSSARYGVEADPLRESAPYRTFWDALVQHETAFEQGPDTYVYPYSSLILAKAGFESTDSNELDDIAAAIWAVEPDSTEFWMMNDGLRLHTENHSIVMEPSSILFFPAGPRTEQGLFVPGGTE